MGAEGSNKGRRKWEAKKKPGLQAGGGYGTERSSTGDDFGVLHWISAPNLELDDDSVCFFWGGRILTAFLNDGTSKSTLKAAMSYMT